MKAKHDSEGMRGNPAGCSDLQESTGMAIRQFQIRLPLRFAYDFTVGRPVEQRPPGGLSLSLGDLAASGDKACVGNPVGSLRLLHRSDQMCPGG